MSELEEKISAVLQDPAQLQSIFAMVKSLGLDAPAGQPERDIEEAAPTQSASATPAEPQLHEPTAPVASFSSPGPPPVPEGQLSRRQENLLNALKPFLRPEKRKKIDRAMQIARLTHLAEFALRGTQEQHGS